MHFTGRTWRPPYEAHSVIIQATSGCTYNKCKFCSLYKKECFQVFGIRLAAKDIAHQIKNIVLVGCIFTLPRLSLTGRSGRK